ncbi:MAG: MraY family glycosyltransferase [Peptococcaceae bacterium]|nr:undecaprenyl/decaprenyl-phosphate alpha-N-acetylglucosaminyl 1-phosphate transferase [Peptococcaceae bacterium]MDH7525982.1 MraY family glycosyltransferase [Peptococcaceae bacterium]
MIATACSLAAAFLLTLLGTPLIRRIALNVRAIDRPGERKIHKNEMPRLGGLAICLAFWAVVLTTREMSKEMYGILGGGFLICLVGIWDDLRGVSPRIKLLVQVTAALFAISMGVRVDFMTHPLGGVIILQYLSYPVTILWIVGITNAVNLIDGLDGLAAGVSAIAAVTLGTVSVLEGFGEVGILAFILAASVLGFLRHNFYPARIFMGDTGSLFLGFNLAAIAILGLTKSATVISLFLPVIILGIPIIDTLFAILRRFHNGKPIFSPDKEHLHHRLMALGLTHRRTVVAIYGVSLLLSLSAVLMAVLTTAQGMLLLVLTTLGVFIGIDRLGILKKEGLEKSEKDEKAARHLAK